MTPQELEIIQKLYMAQQQQQGPNYQLNTPSLSPNNMAQMNAGQQGVMSNTPTTPKAGLDPWSIGIAAGSAAAPVGASLLGRRREYPNGGGGSPSLGMTRGAEVPNVYGGRKSPNIQALLAQFLSRR